jgi:hypothetical protein
VKKVYGHDDDGDDPPRRRDGCSGPVPTRSSHKSRAVLVRLPKERCTVMTMQEGSRREWW